MRTVPLADGKGPADTPERCPETMLKDATSKKGGGIPTREVFGVKKARRCSPSMSTTVRLAVPSTGTAYIHSSRGVRSTRTCCQPLSTHPTPNIGFVRLFFVYPEFLS